MSRSFDEVYGHDRRRVLASVFALCGSAATAEEITQEAFLRAYARWDRISKHERPDLWVRRVAINLATSAYRRRAAERRAFDRARGGAVTGIGELSASTTDVWDAVRSLPRRQAQAVVLVYVGDLSAEEAGRVMGIAAATVRVLLHRARGRLAVVLNELDIEEATT